MPFLWNGCAVSSEYADDIVKKEVFSVDISAGIIRSIMGESDIDDTDPAGIRIR